VRAVGGRRLVVLTGGPGTGKTTTVLRMLLMLQRHAPAPLRVRAAAPTGKAAQRLLQALRTGREALLATPLPQPWRTHADCIPQDDAVTLHRLLELHPRTGRFGRDAGRPLAADVVVVDEASMVDLAMMRALLDAVPPDATLVLVGDADQLHSVAAGSVLMDLVHVLEAEAAPELVRLCHSFRAEHALQAINQAVLAGDPGQLAGAVEAAGASAACHPVIDAASLQARLQAWARRLAALPIRPELPSAGSTPDAGDRRRQLAAEALRALASSQLLCALREGPFGAEAINHVIERLLRQAWSEPVEREWYPGRTVLVTRNDYALRLFNGDLGLCLADADGQLRVWFETAGDNGQPTVRDFATGALPALEGGFAITIHKSQGSEYGHAAVLLPPDATSRAVSRQLLYTGVSRARHALELWATTDVLAAALANDCPRSGGLRDQLRQQPPSPVREEAG